jgi:tetratricopeptide (TPR) repeat protein
LHIPPTVQGILAARIDRLAPDEKALLQQLAVIGRQFPMSLVRQVIAQPEADLYRMLASLQRKEFLYEQPAFPESEYLFKHALTQEVAYNSVLQERRKSLHEKIAQAIEALYRANREDHYSALAHHYSRSGNTQKAVEYLHLAGQQAVQHSANREALNQFTAALELLKTFPETEARNRQELVLQLALGAVLMTVRGQSAPETGAAFQRAQGLSLYAEEISRRFLILAGLRRFYGGRYEFHRAREVAQQMLTLAEQAQDSALLLEANQSLGNIAFWSGEFSTSRRFAERGLSFHNSQEHRLLALQSGMDPGIGCHNFAALTMWFLGYPEQALERSAKALAWGRELGHAHSFAFALIFAAFLHYHRREGRQVQEYAETLFTLATEHGFTVPEFWSVVLRGWALTTQGQSREGLALLRGLARPQNRPPLGQLLSILGADALRIAGEVEEGLWLLKKGSAVGDDGGFWEAETHRLKGELTFQKECQVSSSKFPIPDP